MIQHKVLSCHQLNGAVCATCTSHPSSELTQHHALHTTPEVKEDFGLMVNQSSASATLWHRIHQETHWTSIWGKVGTEAKTQPLLSRKVDQSESDSECNFQLSSRVESGVSQPKIKGGELCWIHERSCFSASSTQQDPSQDPVSLQLNHKNNSGVCWWTLLKQHYTVAMVTDGLKIL